MEQLVREGKVIYVGSSNFAGWHIAQAQWKRRSATSWAGFGAEPVQPGHAHDRTGSDPGLPRIRAGLIPWSPLEGGLLSGALEKAKEGRRSEERTMKLIEKHRGKLEKYEPLCREIGEKPGDVALAWLLHNPAVTSPIIGPRNMEQLTGPPRARAEALGGNAEEIG